MFVYCGFGPRWTRKPTPNVHTSLVSLSLIVAPSESDLHRGQVMLSQLLRRCFDHSLQDKGPKSPDLQVNAGQSQAA